MIQIYGDNHPFFRAQKLNFNYEKSARPMSKSSKQAQKEGEYKTSSPSMTEH